MAINKVVASADEAVAAVSKLGVKDLTVVSNSGGFGIEVWGEHDVEVLHRTGQLKKHIVSAPVNQWMENTLEKRFRAGEVEIEMVAQGTLAERIRAAKAGLGGIFTPVGVGTVLEKGKEIKLIDGQKYLLELAIKADFALIRAHKADRWGNLVYKGNSRTSNATIAGADRVTIAEVDQLVELGELDPEVIVTPGVFVNRVVVR